MYLALNVFCSGGIEQVSQVANQSDSMYFSFVYLCIYSYLYVILHTNFETSGSNREQSEKVAIIVEKY